jgi:hypothetical protein
MIKGSEDLNFSVQAPLTYSRRFIRYIFDNIKEDEGSQEYYK